jgi:GAF domain
LPPFDSGLSSRRDGQHPRIEIEADNPAFSPHALEGLACEHPCTTANVENSVSRPDTSGVGNRPSPSAEDRRYEAGLIHLGSLRRDLPGLGLRHRITPAICGPCQRRPNDDLNPVSLQAVVEELLVATDASRCTLRQESGHDFFPVTHEALAPGTPSIRDERTVDLRTAPVVKQLLDTKRQVVQDDCASAFNDPGFQHTLVAYGGLAAQIVTPVFVDGRLAAIVSLHQLGAPRTWSERERALAHDAAERVRVLLAG